MYLKNKINKFLQKGTKRTILAKKNILLSFFIKAFSMIIVFTMMSVSIKYLGKENYGIWVVLSGLIMWSNVFDLGFSHGLRNRLAESIVNGKIEDGRYYVSTTYAFLLLIAIIMIVTVLPVLIYLDWQNILNSTVLENETIKMLVVLIFLFFILQFILKPIQSIVEAYQWPSLSQGIMVVGAFGALIGILYLLYIKENSFYLYVIIVAGIPVITLFFASVYLYNLKFTALIPSMRYISRKHFNKIAGIGISFFVIQFSILIIFQSDNLLISYLFGPNEVTKYNIVYKYFSIVSITFSVIMAPFWTAFTDAYQKNDFLWIQKTIKTLLFLTSGSLLLSILLFLVSNDIYRYWIDEFITIPKLLSALMGVYVVLMGIMNIYAFFSNGIGKVKVQLIVDIFAAIINIPLSYILGYQLKMGSAGVLLATIISMTFIAGVLLIQYKKIISKTAKGIWNE